MAYLDLDPVAKQTQREMFGPVLSELETLRLLELSPDTWRPQLAIAALGKTLGTDGARTYVSRVQDFFAGGLSAFEIAEGLQK